MPWDGGTTFRSGARFGPEAIRSASGMIRTYNPVQKVQVFGALSAVDFGDAPTAPGYIEETLQRIEQYVKPIAAAGVVSLGMGGDHSVTLAELRALASVHGPLGLVHLDSHTDLWDTYNGLPYSHGTVFRRAIDEGIVDPRARDPGRHARIALRRGRRGAARRGRRRDDPVDRARRACRRTPSPRAPGNGWERARCSARSTSTSSIPPSARAPARRRWAARRATRRWATCARCATSSSWASTSSRWRPQYDSAGQVTALFAANAIFEMLSLVALEPPLGVICFPAG